MSFKKRAGEAYIKYKIRAARGNTFTTELDGILNAFQKGGMILLLISTYFHVLVPLYILPLLWLAQKSFEYCMGYLDEHYLGWWKFETRYMNENVNINPYQVELMSHIKRIEEKIDQMGPEEIAMLKINNSIWP